VQQNHNSLVQRGCRHQCWAFVPLRMHAPAPTSQSHPQHAKLPPQVMRSSCFPHCRKRSSTTLRQTGSSGLPGARHLRDTRRWLSVTSMPFLSPRRVVTNSTPRTPLGTAVGTARSVQPWVTSHRNKRHKRSPRVLANTQHRRLCLPTQGATAAPPRRPRAARAARRALGPRASHPGEQHGPRRRWCCGCGATP